MNKQLREAIIQNEQLDIVLLSETHLQGNKCINVHGFTSFCSNRKEIHVKAPKGSGGVALLIKNEILSDFNVRVIDKEVEGILGVKLLHTESDFSFVVYSCYLAPENSVWGRKSDMYFQHLTSQLYMNEDADFILLGGDFNA